MASLLLSKPRCDLILWGHKRRLCAHPGLWQPPLKMPRAGKRKRTRSSGPVQDAEVAARVQRVTAHCRGEGRWGLRVSYKRPKGKSVNRCTVDGEYDSEDAALAAARSGVVQHWLREKSANEALVLPAGFWARVLPYPAKPATPEQAARARRARERAHALGPLTKAEKAVVEKLRRRVRTMEERSATLAIQVEFHEAQAEELVAHIRAGCTIKLLHSVANEGYHEDDVSAAQSARVESQALAAKIVHRGLYDVKVALKNQIDEALALHAKRAGQANDQTTWTREQRTKWAVEQHAFLAKVNTNPSLRDEAYERAAAVVEAHWRTVRQWVLEFDSAGFFRDDQRGRGVGSFILDNEDISMKFLKWLRSQVSVSRVCSFLALQRACRCSVSCPSAMCLRYPRL